MPIKNKNFLEYIGKRLGVLIPLNKKHGLFGKINNQSCQDLEDINVFGKHIYNKTKEGTHAYEMTISLREEDAMALGYDDFETWQMLIKKAIPLIAEKLNILIENADWGAGCHMESGHPHCQILLWDKNQGIKKPFIHPKIGDEIRIELIKEVFKEDLEKLHQIKNEARAGMIDTANSMFYNFFKPFDEMSDKVFVKSIKELKQADTSLSDSKLLSKHLKESQLTLVAKELFELSSKLPKNGRLMYQFLEPSTKKEVEKFALKLLEINTDCKNEFNKYIDISEEISSYFSNNDKNIEARQNSYDEILKRLCNKILREIKEINKMTYKSKEISYDQYENEKAKEFIKEIFTFLARQSSSNKYFLNEMKNGELSKQARKEYILSQKNTSNIDWER